ncbi:MAG: hypothetical protein Tsb0018_10230 [Opitutales bacterium]|tara:strand:- start:3794 stop:4750 length:957 start_codon:yes stop_codon:yes gene_type:complete
MSFVSGLAKSLQEARVVKVLEDAFESGRLAHAILLQGLELNVLAEVAHALAGALLDVREGFSVAAHPDFFTLRPSNKMRQIGVDDTRALIRALQHTAHQGSRKVAVIYEADRMNTAAANAFLKTLEEPAEGTIVLLLTVRPYDLLSTIRSRCLHFKVPAAAERVQDEAWQAWLGDYEAWLDGIVFDRYGAERKVELTMRLYGLLHQFGALLEDLAKLAWESEKATLPDTLTEDEAVAMEAGSYKRVRRRLFAEIAQATRDFALIRSEEPETTRFALTQALTALERSAGLLEVNFNEVAALEAFLLKSLRIWSNLKDAS